MQRTEIPRDEWPRFIEAASAALTGDEVQITIHTGGAHPGDWRRLHGLSYEIGEDVLWIHTDGVEHQVVRPQKVQTIEQGRRLVALRIESDQATYQLQFRVPAPTA